MYFSHFSTACIIIFNLQYYLLHDEEHTSLLGHSFFYASNFSCLAGPSDTTPWQDGSQMALVATAVMLILLNDCVKIYCECTKKPKMYIS